MICKDQAQTRRKARKSLGDDNIESCRLNNGAQLRSVSLGLTLPFQATDTMPILIPMFHTPGSRIRGDRLLHFWLLDQLSEGEGM
jgi:hypothetical protein